MEICFSYSSVNTHRLFFVFFSSSIFRSPGTHIYFIHSMYDHHISLCAIIIIAENRTTHRQNAQVILFLLFFAYLLPIVQVKSWIHWQNRIMMMAIIKTSIWHGFNVRYFFISEMTYLSNNGLFFYLKRLSILFFTSSVFLYFDSISINQLICTVTCKKGEINLHFLSTCMMAYSANLTPLNSFFWVSYCMSAKPE
jgi:hypothetical protein